MKQLLLVAMVFSFSSLSAQVDNASGKEVKTQTDSWREKKKELAEQGWKTIYDSDAGEIPDSTAGVFIRVSVRWREDAEKKEGDKGVSSIDDRQKAPANETAIVDEVPTVPARPVVTLLADPESMELTVLLDEVVFSRITVLCGDKELFTREVEGEETKFDISFLPPGIYNLKLEGYGGVEERTFVKR